MLLRRYLLIGNSTCLMLRWTDPQLGMLLLLMNTVARTVVATVSIDTWPSAVSNGASTRLKGSLCRHSTEERMDAADAGPRREPQRASVWRSTTWRASTRSSAMASRIGYTSTWRRCRDPAPSPSSGGLSA